MADDQSRAGATYKTKDILDFVNRIHAAHDGHLQRAFDAPGLHGMPEIQVSPAEGKFLGLLLHLIQAKRVVELGTLAGYSALWMARYLPPGGHIWTVEADPKHAEVAQANLKAAGISEHVTVVEGAALSVMPILARHGPFDAVFLDADKENYGRYALWAANNLREGGLLLADNAYYFSQLMDDTPGAAAVRRFHQEVPALFDSVCLPTPDGFLVGIRRGSAAPKPK